MLASSLATIAWLCFGLGVLSQIGWLVTDGRRPDMPSPVLDCMVGTIGQLIFAPLILILAFWSPEALQSAMGVVFVMVAVATQQEPSWRSPTPNVAPLTETWKAAIRRQYFRTRLCVASAGVIAAIVTPETMLLCGLGTVAAMNLHYLQVAYRNSFKAETGTRLLLSLPFILTFFAFVWGLFPGGRHGILAAGLTLSYPDLNLTVLAPIPGNDEPTLSLLKTYIGLSLLILLIALLMDMFADRLRQSDAAHLLARSSLRWLRAGLMAVLFFLLEPDAHTTASAALLRVFLIIVEVMVFFVPSPDPEIGTEVAQPAEVAAQA